MEESTRTGAEPKAKEKTEETSVFSRFKNWVINKLEPKGEDGKKAKEALAKISEYGHRNWIEWCAAGNYFGFYSEDERDEKKVGWSGDRAANELATTTYVGVASTALGVALLPFCPVLGILIIATGNAPRPVLKELKKWISDETFGLVPLDEIPSPTTKLSDAAHETHENLNARVEKVKTAIADVEKALAQQEAERVKTEENKRQQRVAGQKHESSSDKGNARQSLVR